MDNELSAEVDRFADVAADASRPAVNSTALVPLAFELFQILTANLSRPV